MENQKLLKSTKIVYLLIGLSISLVMVTDVNAWYSEGWDSKKELNFTNMVNEKLTDFPTYLSVDTTTLFNEGKLQADCGDLRFINDTDNTTIPYELENCDTAGGNSSIWLKLSYQPLGTSTVNMYYNNSLSSNGENATHVWDNNYKLVLHFAETSGNVTDSTTGGHNAHETVIQYNSSSACPYGICSNFQSGGIVRIADHSDLEPTSEYTIENWWNKTEAGTINSIHKRGSATNYPYIIIPDNNPNTLIAFDDGTGAGGWVTTSSLTNTWYYETTTWNTTSNILEWKRNITGHTNQWTGITSSPSTNAYDVGIGCYGTTYNSSTTTFWIDELRLSDIQRSDQWLNASYLGMDHVIGSETSQGVITNITSCQSLNQANTTYYLMNDILNYGVGDCFPVSANNITLECNDFKIDGTGSNDAIDLGTSDNFTVRNCNITNWGVGIRGDGASDFNSSNNEINDMAGYSIWLKNANNPNVEYNDLWLATNGGIRFESMNNPYISDVNTWDNGIGVSVGNGQGGELENVYSFDNTDVGFKFYQISILFAVNCSMINNVNSGLWLSHANVTFSIIQDNGIGVRIGTGGNCNVYNNLLNNTVNFQNDTVGSNHQWNTTNQTGTRRYSSGTNIGGNYYTHSNSSGYSDNCVDSDTDGFCDNSYQLSEFNIDYLPYSDEFVVTTTTTTIPTTTTTTIELLPIGNYTQWYCSDNLLVKNYTAKGENSTYEYIVCEYNCSSFLGKARCNYEPFVVWIVFIVLLIGIAVGLKFIINHNIFD